MVMDPYEIAFSNLKYHARRRHELHRGQASSRPLSKDYELVGLIGEVAFAKKFQLPVDMELKPGGDGRIDFTFPSGLTVDVKSYRKPYNLLREVDKPHADILVLTKVDMDRRVAKLLGWEFDEEMLKCLTKDFGYGIINHYKPVTELKRMRELSYFLGLE